MRSGGAAAAVPVGAGTGLSGQSGIRCAGHSGLVERTLQDLLAGHVSRDSTVIPVRERLARERKQIKAKRKRGRPRTGEQRPKQRRRLERKGPMTDAGGVAGQSAYGSVRP